MRIDSASKNFVVWKRLLGPWTKPRNPVILNDNDFVLCSIPHAEL
jgi:hypothetical protein